MPMPISVSMTPVEQAESDVGNEVLLAADEAPPADLHEDVADVDAVCCAARSAWRRKLE